jgi:NADPH2:quinone reductase
MLMRGFVLEHYVGPDGLAMTQLPPPELASGDLLVQVEAIGVNYPDLLMTRGHYQLKPDLPVVPGCEIAGVVAKTPVGSALSVGDRITAFIWTGGYAEYAAVPESAAIRIPDGMDFVTAASMIVNYHTVHFALARRARLLPGERLLVLGAGGGIGGAAVQVGRAIVGPAGQVIAGYADDQQLAQNNASTADQSIVLGHGFSQQIRELTSGDGVDVVLDPLGDWIFAEALRTLAPEGRILIVGFAAGAIPTVTVNRLLLRNCSAVGVAWGAFVETEPEILGAAANELDAMWTQGSIRPTISLVGAFEDLPQMLDKLSAGHIRGKAVAVTRAPQD